MSNPPRIARILTVPPLAQGTIRSSCSQTTMWISATVPSVVRTLLPASRPSPSSCRVRSKIATKAA